MIFSDLKKFLSGSISIVFIPLSSLHGQDTQIPFTVDSLYDFSEPATLGLHSLPGAETFTIFSPTATDNKYNHGVVLYPCKGKLYAQWQSSAIDEDSPDTRVFFSDSNDGEHWSKAIALFPNWNNGMQTCGGWWSHGDTLVAYLCGWSQKKDSPREGYTCYSKSTDGIHWGMPQPVRKAGGSPVPGIIEQDLHSLPDGRLITAFHIQPGLIATPYYTDDPMGISGWHQGQMEGMPVINHMSRGIEPAWFYRGDSAIVMIFRDQGGSFRKLASISVDRGRSWTRPTLVNATDSRSKQSAGNLPDGTSYMVNNPSGNKNRYPLVITLSRHGFIFDKAFLLRSGGEDLQPMRFKGKYKSVGFSYPKSVVWGNYLYVGYASNEEEIQLTRIPLAALSY